MSQIAVQKKTGSRFAELFPKQRIAVALLFLMNGYLFGGWAPKIPEFAERLGLDSGAMGLMILVFGLGSLTSMPITGAMTAQHGSTVVVKITALAALPTLFLMTVVPSVPTAVVAIFYFGGAVAAMDVAMNANAVAVEKSMRRAVMSSCHAFWSLGGLIGAATGGFLMAQIGTFWHGVIATIVAVLMVAIAWHWIVADKIHHVGAKPKLRLPRQPLPWLIGIMALFSMVPEGAVLDWGAFYLRQDFGASVTMAGFGFAAFSLTMAIMRFAGDLVRDRFGAVKTLRYCTVTAIVGMLIAAFASSPVLVIVGFALCGVGISNMVPIAFSMAGNMPGIAPGVGLSIATTMGYSGMLVAPSAIGLIAEHSGFSIIFATLPLLLLVVLAFSGLARFADQDHGAH